MSDQRKYSGWPSLAQQVPKPAVHAEHVSDMTKDEAEVEIVTVKPKAKKSSGTGAGAGE